VISRRKQGEGSDESSSYDENPLVPVLLLIDAHEHHENLAANIISPHTWPLLHPGAGHVFRAGSPTERFLCRIRVGLWGCSRGARVKGVLSLCKRGFRLSRETRFIGKRNDAGMLRWGMRVRCSSVGSFLLRSSGVSMRSFSAFRVFLAVPRLIARNRDAVYIAARDFLVSEAPLRRCSGENNNPKRCDPLFS